MCVCVWVGGWESQECGFENVKDAMVKNAGNWGSIHGSGRSPGERHGNPLQYPCLENSMDKGGWWATAHGIAKIGHN